MKRIFPVALAMLLAACGKSDSNSNNGGTSFTVTETDLAGTSGKQWDISYLKITYYNASGGEDSTVNKGGGASDVAWFGTTSSGAQYYATAPLDQVLPGVGRWTLNTGSKLLTFNCSALGCSTVETWQIENYSPRNAYGESMNLMQQQNLSGGRRRILKARLYKQ